MREVFIDGVRYVPEKEAQPSDARAIKVALLSKFWGDVSKSSDEDLDKKWEDVYICVSDMLGESGYSPDQLHTIDELLADILACKEAIA